MKKLLTSFIAFSFCISIVSQVQAGCTLSVPVITQNSVTACAISISWVGDPHTAYYVVRYKVSQSGWQPGVNVGTLTSYTFTGLNAHTQYVVEVKPYCSNNGASAGSQLLITTLSCSPPPNITATNIGATGATISWQVCGGGINSHVRYRPQGIPSWQNLAAGNNTSLVLSGLTHSTTYQYEVNTCGDGSTWSTLDTFKTLDSVDWKPNILCIYLDDSRYDPFAPDGGPSFFQSPGINRIADEGVKFVYAFPAFSLCSPSRASIMSGLYPHHHGVISNAMVDTFPFPTVAQILHDDGYYTGFTGKYGFEKFPHVTGYDYYCESTDDVYWNATYSYNGQLHVVIPGHKTDVITSKALEFLNSVPPGKRFLLYVAHKAPHVPYTPRTQDDGIYSNAQIPFPDNFEKWTENVPSPYNTCYDPKNEDSEKAQLESYYELLAGAEASIDTILTYLENKGILDSTLVIFSSDNGFLLGEHMLGGKEIALEESIRLPMFIRYPRWFAPGTTVSDEMAMNIDIAPTILEAAGIPDTFNMDGMSMRSLVNHTADRKELLYEYFYRNSCNPTLTAVRDFNYKYISNRCADTVEEFYDLVNDPKENINLINSPNYASLIQKYRIKLDSLKQVYGYILMVDTIQPCSLQNPDTSIINLPCSLYTCNISATDKVTNISSGGTCHDGKIKITPSGTFNFHLHLELYDVDSVLLSSIDPPSDTAAYIFENLSSGTYLVKVFDGSCCEIDLNNIKVQCPKPTGLYTSSISATSATVNWTNQECNNGYKLQYRRQGTSSWTTKRPAANVTNHNIGGLIANTTYEWKVATSCANANPDTYSSYSAVQTFTSSLRIGESEEEDNYTALSIYPNPAGEVITVTVNAKDAWLLQVQDPVGQTLIEGKISDKNSVRKLNVAALPAGIYLVTIKTASGILQKPFVKY